MSSGQISVTLASSSPALPRSSFLGIVTGAPVIGLAFSLFAAELARLKLSCHGRALDGGYGRHSPLRPLISMLQYSAAMLLIVDAS